MSGTSRSEGLATRASSWRRNTEEEPSRFWSLSSGGRINDDHNTSGTCSYRTASLQRLDGPVGVQAAYHVISYVLTSPKKVPSLLIAARQLGAAIGTAQVEKVVPKARDSHAVRTTKHRDDVHHAYQDHSSVQSHRQQRAVQPRQSIIHTQP